MEETSAIIEERAQTFLPDLKLRVFCQATRSNSVSKCISVEVQFSEAIKVIKANREEKLWVRKKMIKNEKMESYNTFSKECLSTGRLGLPRFRKRNSINNYIYGF